jgi:O-antigen/teichoic acid export membrane protein
MSNSPIILNDDLNPPPVWLELLPLFLKNRIKGRPILQKIISNINWLLFDRVLRMGVGLFVGVWVARYLGPEKFGIINYSLALVGLFGAFAGLGLDSIVVRDIVKSPTEKNSLMGTAFVLKLLASIFSFLLCAITIYFLKDDFLIRISVIIVAGALVFQSLDIIRVWFGSQIKSKYIVIAQDSAFIIVSSIKVFFLVSKAPFIFFVGAILGEIILASVGLLLCYRLTHESVFKWKFKLNIARKLLVDSWPLMLSTFAVVIYMRIDQIMLAQMLGEHSVGIYSAAVKISEIWYFIPMIVSTSLYPRFIELYGLDKEIYTKKLVKVMSLFFWISLVVASIVFLFSTHIISILFGTEYIAAASVLSIHIFAGIIVSTSVIFGQRYILKNQQKISLYGTVVGAIMNIILNFILIPTYGVKGTAIATLISYFVPTIFVAIFFDRSVGVIFLKSFFNLRVWR